MLWESFLFRLRGYDSSSRRRTDSFSFLFWNDWYCRFALFSCCLVCCLFPRPPSFSGLSLL